jgi:hypothetical protein
MVFQIELKSFTNKSSTIVEISTEKSKIYQRNDEFYLNETICFNHYLDLFQVNLLQLDNDNPRSIANSSLLPVDSEQQMGVDLINPRETPLNISTTISIHSLLSTKRDAPSPLLF